jgi:NTE family protein
MKGGKTALVLSAGGMFGAYQAGVWEALAGRFRPDIVIGTSVGALNGWAIAGGCDPEELRRRWLDRQIALQWRRTWNPLAGLVDEQCFDRCVEELYRAFQPRTEFGVVLTQLPNMRQRVFRGGEVTWKHLAVACSAPVVFRPRRIDGVLYADGGLVNALPLWAAAKLGADRILAINLLEHLPSALLRTWRRVIRPIARRSMESGGLEVLTIAAGAPLGSMYHMFEWEYGNVYGWLEQGKRDGIAAIPDLERLLSQ